MKKFIGTKIIHAETAEPIMGSPAGMKVQYPTTGHVSWSPQDEFERHYRSVDAMTFGQAMEAVRLGEKVRRRSWSVSTYVYLEVYTSGPVRSQVMQRMLWEQIHRDQARTMEYTYQPNQLDMAAEDWAIVEEGGQTPTVQQGTSIKPAH